MADHSLAPLRSRLQSLVAAAAAWVPPGAARWITLLSFGFLLAALVGHGRQVLALSPDLQGWLWLCLGVGLSLLSLVVSAFSWGVLLRWLGHGPRWQALLSLVLRSNGQKYLPGGIWHLAMRVQQLRQGAVLAAPLAGGPALVAVLLEPLLAAVAALALVSPGGLQGGLGLLAVIPIVLLWPRWLQPLLTWLERRKAASLASEAPANAAVVLPQGYPWVALLAAAGFVLVRCAGFACCVMAFDLQPALGWSGWLAGFALAWTAGLVVPGAPGGLGVFEVVLLLRLGVVLSEPPLLALAISYRLVVSLADAIAALCAEADARGLGLAQLRN
ncbi:MAG: UPF0104 family protein [Cyanobacteria bacterium K_DeepCast_35m_m2_023]|nr:UPF0104 family protein [Cyanobacteria bacterium K_DeepCast_35m_m2_023]